MPRPRQCGAPNFYALAEATGVPRSTLHGRWHRGLRGADLTAPPAKFKLPFNSVELSQATGVGANVIRQRWARGDRGARLTRPAQPSTKDYRIGDLSYQQWADKAGLDRDRLYKTTQRFRRRGLSVKQALKAALLYLTN